MLFLLAVANSWSIVELFVVATTCIGAVKLGLETYEKVLDIKDKKKDT